MSTHMYISYVQIWIYVDIHIHPQDLGLKRAWAAAKQPVPAVTLGGSAKGAQSSGPTRSPPRD